MSEVVALLSTGLVSVLSIPYVEYSEFVSTFRSSLCLIYLVIDCFRWKKTLETYILYILHHLSAIYLILNEKHACTEVINGMFFLEFSSFLYQFCKLLRKWKTVAKLYWCFDRVIRYPIMIFTYRHCLENYYLSVFTLEYLGILWSCEVLKIQNKYLYSTLLTSITYVII